MGYLLVYLILSFDWNTGDISTVKVFIDRISDYLDLPDLLEDGRQLRGKRGYVYRADGHAMLYPM
jgi:hypothetical protein